MIRRGLWVIAIFAMLIAIAASVLWVWGHYHPSSFIFLTRTNAQTGERRAFVLTLGSDALVLQRIRGWSGRQLLFAPYAVIVGCSLCVTVCCAVGIYHERERKRLKLGLCMKCGYDIRASEERCPECGSPIAIVSGPRFKTRRGEAWSRTLRREMHPLRWFVVGMAMLGILVLLVFLPLLAFFNWLEPVDVNPLKGKGLIEAALMVVGFLAIGGSLSGAIFWLASWRYWVLTAEGVEEHGLWLPPFLMPWRAILCLDLTAWPVMQLRGLNGRLLTHLELLSRADAQAVVDCWLRYRVGDEVAVEQTAG